MKNKNYKMAILKKRIRGMESRKIRSWECELNQEEAEYIENILHKRIEPTKYTIKTQTFRQIHKIKNVLLKDMHYANKRGKETIRRSLTKEEKNLLKEWKIAHWPVVYRIYSH